jgi:hypothetical protein
MNALNPILFLKLSNDTLYIIYSYLIPGYKNFKWRPSGSSSLFKVFLLNGQKICNHKGEYLTFIKKKNGKIKYFITKETKFNLCKCGRTNDLAGSRRISCSTHCSINHDPKYCSYLFDAYFDDEEYRVAVNRRNFECNENGLGCGMWICGFEKYEVTRYKSIYVGRSIISALLKLFMYEIQENRISNICMLCNSHFSNIINKRYFINDSPKILKKNSKYTLDDHSFYPPTDEALELANARIFPHDWYSYEECKRKMRSNDVLIIWRKKWKYLPDCDDIALVIHNEDEFYHYDSCIGHQNRTFCIINCK